MTEGGGGSVFCPLFPRAPRVWVHANLCFTHPPPYTTTSIIQWANPSPLPCPFLPGVQPAHCRPCTLDPLGYSYEPTAILGLKPVHSRVPAAASSPTGHRHPRWIPGENPKEGKSQAGTTRPQDVNRRDQQRNPGTSTTPARPSPGGAQDTEMGPCRRHLDSVLQQLQTEVYRGAQTLYVPNCDHRGFYRKRQCRSSQGQRRGPCWCVDRMGQPLPGSPEGEGGSSCPTGSSG
ncbi:insulin-like growth factor-binding protein 6 isoform X2 [Panthera pardus]|uniref:Insulin-like growth factor-binding protein 6 n=1 Tax=Panthera pardus TaxID=9691 RepID=A0A9W2UXK5_PANPR|nr:insulin-like growth factor-binding protein 6 isoform X2 [Panthera pardus]